MNIYSFVNDGKQGISVHAYGCADTGKRRGISTWDVAAPNVNEAIRYEIKASADEGMTFTQADFRVMPCLHPKKAVSQ